MACAFLPFTRSRENWRAPSHTGGAAPCLSFAAGGSKVILAALSPARHKRLYESYAAEIAEAGLGDTWKAFRAQMLKIQHEGHVISVGQLDPDARPAPPFRCTQAQSLEPAALILVTTRSRFALTDQARLIELMKNSARQIELASSRDSAAGLVSPHHPRAINRR